MEVNVAQISFVWSQCMNIIHKATIIESQNYKRLSKSKEFMELGHIILPSDSVNFNRNSIEKKRDSVGKYFITFENQGFGVV